MQIMNKVKNKEEHPRFRYYPSHEHYYNMKCVFRPFLMFTNEPLFKSPALNTDCFGFREQFDFDENIIEISELKNTYEHCNLLLGGSTAFGVDASDDRSTIANFLNVPKSPCINLGIRSFSNQQELQCFLFFKKYFPKINNVVLLSGINDCALTIWDNAIQFEEFGGIYFKNFCLEAFNSMYHFSQDNYFLHRVKLYDRFERKYHSFGKIRKGIINFLFKSFVTPNYVGVEAKTKKRLNYKERVEAQLKTLENSLHIWQLLAKGEGCKITYFLQPAINWTEKKLTNLERACFENDLKEVKELELFLNKDFYDYYSNRILEICVANGISFFDINPYLNQFSDVTIFTDFCHLTDEGNRICSDFIREKINLP